MAYQINRKSRVRETLELHDGDKTLTVECDINIDQMGAAIFKAQENVANASGIIRENPKSQIAQEAFGKAVIALFGVIFGEKGTEDLLAFYEDNYGEMLVDVCPFINDFIMPKVREASEARKAQLKAAAASSRRGLFKR